MKYALCAVVLFAFPAFAAISPIQSNATWGATGTTCAVTFSSNPTNGHLIVVWASWTTSGTNNVTATVGDTETNGFLNAVGPTIQSASNTASQIFYAKNIAGGADTVTVTFSSAPSSSNCVIGEVSGADIINPLDSVTAGYSLSATTLLDSGTAIPANANLLLFGGGTGDAGTASVGTGFSLVQKNGGSVTEYEITSGNNTLQRATAGLTSSGNWVMQMAVFRDASWTVAGGWSPARFAQILDASQFPGSDIGDQINHAYAALPSYGGHIIIPGKPDGNCYDFTTPIVFNTPGKYVLLEYAGAGGAVNTSVVIGCLNYKPTLGTAIYLDYANTTQASGASISSVHGLRNILLVNNQCQTNLGCGGSAIGIDIGNTYMGIQSATMENVSVIGFSKGYRNLNFFATPVTWINPIFWDNVIAWDIGNVSTQNVFGGFFSRNVECLYADDPNSRSELHFTGTTFVENSACFNYNNVTGLPAYVFLDHVHFENGQATNAPTNYIQGDVNVHIWGGISEDDSSATPCTYATWFFEAGGSYFKVDGMTFVVNTCNPSVGIINADAQARIDISGFIVNPSVLTHIVGGTNAPSATVRMSGGNITNAPLPWVYESPIALGTQLNQTAAKNFAGSCTMSASSTCTFTSVATFSTGYLCFVSIDHASTPPATAISARCSISGTTVTIKAGANNSLTWDALLIGNPN